MKRCREHNLNFAPYIAITNLILGEEFARVIKSIAQRLEQKWKKPYSIEKNHMNSQSFVACPDVSQEQEQKLKATLFSRKTEKMLFYFTD